MKTFNKTRSILISISIIFIAAFMSCSKSKTPNPTPTTEKESIKITASKINTIARNPALGNQSKMCFGNNKIYTFDRSNSKFMSYDITANAWSSLAHDNQLEFAGYTGQMLYTPAKVIYYLHDMIDIYTTNDYNEVAFRNRWGTTKSINPAYSSGESGYVVVGKDIYTAGGRMRDGKNSSTDIRKYSPSSSTWTKVADMPISLTDANAILIDKKMYIIGKKEDGNTGGCIFDTKGITRTEWKVPGKISRIDNERYQMAVYKDYLFFSNSGKTFYLYNLKSEEWLENTVQVDGEFLSGSVNLFVSEDNFYAAGEKDGNFALYQLQVSFPAE